MTTIDVEGEAEAVAGGSICWNSRTLFGVSRDMEFGAQSKTGGAWFLIQDDADFVREAKGRGFKILYRQSGDGDGNGLLDSNKSPILKAKALSFVDERVAKGADAIYLTNEIKFSLALMELTGYMIDRAVQLGAICVPFNYGTHAPLSDWIGTLPMASYAVSKGMPVGFHYYPDKVHDNQLNNWMVVQSLTGGEYWATEFAPIRSYDDADHGFRGLMEDDEVIKFIDDHGERLTKRRVLAFWFSLNPWPNDKEAKDGQEGGGTSGFGTIDHGAIVDHIGVFNQSHAYKGGLPVADTYPVGSNPKSMQVAASDINLRTMPGAIATSSVIRNLKQGEVVTVFDAPAIEAVGAKEWKRVKTSKNETGFCATILSNGSKVFSPAGVPLFLIKYPFRRTTITKHFNAPSSYPNAPNRKQIHEGIDLVDQNTLDYKTDPMIHVGAPGTVIESDFDAKGYGNFVVVDHNNGYRTLYGHMDRVFVKVGDVLADWEIIGIMGSTGNVTGPHCHMNVMKPGGGGVNYVYPDVLDPEIFLVNPTASSPPVIDAKVLDVSQAQGTIDWAAIKAAGVTQVIIRATQGATQEDTRFNEHFQGAVAAGLQVRAYHALIASQNGVAQATSFLKKVNITANPSLPLVIDVELDNGQTPDTVAENLFQMCQEVERATGRKPMIYTRISFWNNWVGLIHDDYFSQCPLWIAAWTDAAAPALPRGFKTWVLWQYTDAGHVDGIAGNVDLSRTAA